MSEEKKESVNHPLHYGGDNTYEHIKVVEAWGLNYALGNCTKYICRAGHKDPKTELEDLKKALWYLQHEVDRVKAEKQAQKPLINSWDNIQEGIASGRLRIEEDGTF